MIEIQNLLDKTLPFVTTLLKDYGEFYPLATAVNLHKEVEQVLLEEDEENDFPTSATVIGELKKAISWQKDEFIAIAIFYNVALKEEQTDAIAVFVELKEGNQAFTFYYPYKIIDREVVFSESWKAEKEMEIFIN
jgi:hypothetical protein